MSFDRVVDINIKLPFTSVARIVGRWISSWRDVTSRSPLFLDIGDVRAAFRSTCYDTGMIHRVYRSVNR